MQIDFLPRLKKNDDSYDNSVISKHKKLDDS